MRRTHPRTVGAAIALALGGLAACQDELPVSPDVAAIRPSLDVEEAPPAQRSLPLDVAAGEELVPWRPPMNANSGVFLLPKACDVLIADAPEPEEPGEPLVVEGSLYRYQLLVDVPSSAPIKLVDPDSPEYRRWESTASGPLPDGVTLDPIEVDAEGHAQFVCNAEDPLAPGWRVVDPLTDHAVKGAGLLFLGQLNTVNLNGYGIRLAATGRVSGVPYADLRPKIGMVDEDRDGIADVDDNGVPLPGEPYDNMGIVLMGEGNRLTNSSDNVALINGGWGHAIELEGIAGTVSGKLPVGDVLKGTATFNIVVHGALGARLVEGEAVIKNVKAIENDLFEDDPVDGLVPVGVGFELRRCMPGSRVTISNSHFEGNGEAAIIRECGLGSPNEDWGGDVFFQKNYVSSSSGVGLNTRETTGGLGSSIIIQDNVFDMKGTGSHAIEWTRETTGLTIRRNIVQGLGASACPVFNEGRDTGGFPTPAWLIANNTFAPATAEQLVQLCGIPVNGGTPGTPPPPPPANVAPTATVSTVCTARECTLTMTARDPDGTIASHVIAFGDGTTQSGTGAPPATLTRSYASTVVGLVTPTLTVTDNGGNPSALSFQATSNPVMPTGNAADQITANVTATCLGTRCTADARGSHAELAGAGVRITGREWVYRVTGTTEQIAFGTGGQGANLPNLAVGQTYQVRVRLTDSRGVSRWSAWTTGANVLTPITLSVAKGPLPHNLAANRRSTLTWAGPRSQVAIFEGASPDALSPTPVATRPATGSYLAATAPVGVPRYYQVCLVNNPGMCSAVSSQVMYTLPTR